MQAERITRSRIFQKALGKAKRLLSQPDRIMATINQALNKSSTIKETPNAFESVRDKFNLLIRMIKAYVKGQYHKLPKATILKGLAVLLYFVWIVDLIPDFIFFIGLVDDVTLIAWFLSSINQELEDFREWEAEQKLRYKKEEPAE